MIVSSTRAAAWAGARLFMAPMLVQEAVEKFWPGLICLFLFKHLIRDAGMYTNYIAVTHGVVTAKSSTVAGLIEDIPMPCESTLVIGHVPCP